MTLSNLVPGLLESTRSQESKGEVLTSKVP